MIYDTPANLAIVYSCVKLYEQQQPSVFPIYLKPTNLIYQLKLTRSFIRILLSQFLRY